MKKIFCILFVFFLTQGSYSQDYYFYNGNKIELEQRPDKVAIVINSTIFSQEAAKRNILANIDSRYELKEIEHNVYLINFKENKSISEVQTFITSTQARINFIKFITPVYYGGSKKVTQVPADEFIVRLRNIKDKELLNILNVKNGVQIVGNISDEKGFLLRSMENVSKNALELSEMYFSSDIFEYAEPNFIYPEYCLLNFDPNDQYYNEQWALRNVGQSVNTESQEFGDQPFVNGIPGADMKVNLAWDYTTGSPSIEIGVFDTGIDSTHPDFQAPGHLMAGYDAINNTYGVPTDPGWHGTGTAGLIGAVMNNSIGVAGIAPTCRLMSVRIFDENGSSTVAAIGRGFDTARVKGLDILSNSWGGVTPGSTITNAINNAAILGRNGLGCIILFASGNDGVSSPLYPSYLSNVTSVGASTPHDQKKAPGTGNQFRWGSNYGENAGGDLDVVAPSGCYTTDVQGAGGYRAGDYDFDFWGTSATCPNAAGIAALILSVNPSQTRLQVIDNLYRGCDKIDNLDYSILKAYGRWNPYCGYGRVNAYNSVRLAAGSDVTPPTINHRNNPSHSSTYPTIVYAEILDQNGFSVPSIGNNQPKLFYRLNKNFAGWSTFDSLPSIGTSGNYFYFAVPGSGYETQVQYYIGARDHTGNETTFPRSAPHPFWLCYYSIGAFAYESNVIRPFSCPDPGVTYSPTVSFGNFIILETYVKLHLRHSAVGDEIIQIFSPISDANNNRKCLFASNGYDGDNIDGATVSDLATQFWTSANPPYTNGFFKPDYPLRGYNGTNASGEWKLINYDQYSGDAGFFDSARITFTRTAGVTSASARLNTPADSILNFGTVNYSQPVIRTFYLKNDGTSELRVSSVYFSGTLSNKFSLLSNLSLIIPPGDSGLFIVRLDLAATDVETSMENEIIDAFENAVMNIVTNDPSKPVFKVSLQSDNNLTDVKNLRLKVFIEGFYDPDSDSMIGDTLTVYLRQSFAPFDILDSSKSFVNNSGLGSFNFLNASNGVNYYLQVKHRNSIETWSQFPGQSFTSNFLYYDFTSNISNAYGNNMIRVDVSPVVFAIYSGDVNQDGIVDASDLSLVDNDASNSVSGYVNTDVTGDNFVDGSDLSVVDNNAFNSVSVTRPQFD